MISRVCCQQHLASDLDCCLTGLASVGNAMADEAEAMDVEVQQEDNDKQKVNAGVVAHRAITSGESI